MISYIYLFHSHLAYLINEHYDKENVESIRRIHARWVALEGTFWMNQEGKTCAELVELPLVYKIFQKNYLLDVCLVGPSEFY